MQTKQIQNGKVRSRELNDHTVYQKRRISDAKCEIGLVMLEFTN